MFYRTPFLLTTVALTWHVASTASACSDAAEATWQAACPARTSNNKQYAAFSGLTAAEVNADESGNAYTIARLSALKLSAQAGNAVMTGLRKKSRNWYDKSLAKFTTYICVQSSSAEELERCVSNSSSDAARDIDGQCIVTQDVSSCSEQDLCERKASCKWDDAVSGSTEVRHELFQESDVAPAFKWVESGYPSSLAPFVAPGIVLGVLTSLSCIAFVVLRCVFNRCGGRKPDERGYSRCDILVPAVIFSVCSLAVLACMIATVALNTNISHGIDSVLSSLEITLENADVFVSNLLTPLEAATAHLSTASAAVSHRLKNTEWVATDGATLKRMIADFEAIYASQGPFPLTHCNSKAKRATAFCVSCPDAVCGTSITDFVDNSTAIITARSDAVQDTVQGLTTALGTEANNISTALRTAALGISNMGALTHSSKEAVDVMSTTFNNYSFSRSALVLSVFLFGLLSSVLGFIAIYKNVCTTKTSKWVHLLHVSWLLGVLVCVLGFVLSASLLAVGAVWFDSCEYMEILHSDVSPYAPTQLSTAADACFTGSSILTPLGLDDPLAFSCALEDSYMALETASLANIATVIAHYGNQVADYDLINFGFNSTVSRNLVVKLSAATKAADKREAVAFTQETVLTPWVAYNGTKSSFGCDGQTIDDEDVPVCYMEGICTSSRSASTSKQTACKTAFSTAYAYILAFTQAQSMLTEMREALLGDTGTAFGSQWTHAESISEFAAAYVAKLEALETGPLATLLGAQGAVRELLQTVETVRCSGDCVWVNLSFDAVHDALCGDVLGTTMALALCVLCLSLCLLPLAGAAVTLQKRLRGVAKGTYGQLEKRLRELEQRAKQQEAAKETTRKSAMLNRSPRIEDSV